IISGFGGTIELESTVGQGSIFRVRLPESGALPETAAPSHSERPPREATQRGRVLIVDDDHNVAKTLGMLLDAEHDVRVLTKGREALELVLGGARFDLIFCDLMMPEMTGMDLHAALLEAVPEQAE